MAPKNPIIIFGTGRSGTTILHKMLSEHHHLTWLSVLNKIFPKNPGPNKMLMNAIDWPLFEKPLKRLFIPGERYRFWETHAKGFSTPCRDLLATDLSEKTKASIRKATSQLTTRKRSRLLLKVTGWPRLGYLSEAFPDAKFVHVIRDGRGVANSLYSVDFWKGWEGPNQWRWGALTPEQQQEWEQYDRSFIVLAAIQWKILMDAAEKAKQSLDPSRLLEVKYEDLCTDPIALFKQVTEFCHLEWTASFEQRLSRYSLRNSNLKYTKELNPQQQKDLENVLQDYLARYNYPMTSG